MSLLAHLIGQRDLAEDLTQEVFLRVYPARKRYVPGAKFSTWLFTIAGNVASNAMRSQVASPGGSPGAADERFGSAVVRGGRGRGQWADADSANR